MVCVQIHNLYVCHIYFVSELKYLERKITPLIHYFCSFIYYTQFHYRQYLYSSFSLRLSLTPRFTLPTNENHLRPSSSTKPIPL